MVVGHFAVIHKRLVRLDRGAKQLRGEGRVRLHLDSPDPLRQRLHNVGREVAGIRPRIRHDLVMLVKTLQDGERLLRGIAKLPVRIPLQFREIVQLGREGFLLCFGDLDHFRAFFPFQRIQLNSVDHDMFT